MLCILPDLYLSNNYEEKTGDGFHKRPGKTTASACENRCASLSIQHTICLFPTTVTVSFCSMHSLGGTDEHHTPHLEYHPSTAHHLHNKVNTTPEVQLMQGREGGLYRNEHLPLPPCVRWLIISFVNYNIIYAPSTAVT